LVFAHHDEQAANELADADVNAKLFTNAAEAEACAATQSKDLDLTDSGRSTFLALAAMLGDK
jgi:hypothetical protein